MRLIAANWKMNPQTLSEATRLAMETEKGLGSSLRGKIEVAICPPSVFLAAVEQETRYVHVGAQNVSAEAKGPHTGEISAGELSEFGVRYVIIGHSERRAMGESDEFINRKIKIALENKIEPILCVGFGTTKTMSEAKVQGIIKKQLTAGLKGVKSSDITIAYEPVWAISKGPGTAVSVPARHVVNIIEYINSAAPGARVLYGGSITSQNASELARHDMIEGGLVGGASLDAREFLKIIKAFT